MPYETITSRDDLKRFLACDKIALRIPASRKRPRPFVDLIWKYEILLRKTEYYAGCSGAISKLLFFFYKLRFKRMGVRLGFTLDPFVFGPGLSIAHYGCLTVNPKARVGANCRIHEGVTLGATNGSDDAPVLGDGCFVGSGAKIIGGIKLGDFTAIGAGAVVVKSFPNGHCTLGGVPASIISDNDSRANVVEATSLYECGTR